MGYIPPFKANLCIFAIHTTFLSGLRTTFIDTGHKDSSFFENNKTFSKKVNDLCPKKHFGITKYAVAVVVTTICFAIILHAVVRSRQLHEYKSNKSGDYLTFHTPQRADC